MLVGRDAELTALRTVLTGDRQLTVIEGESGIGKSALLARARMLAEEQGFTVLSARADALEQDFAFGVVRQLLELPLHRIHGPGFAHRLAGPASLAATVFDLTAGVDTGGATYPVLHGLYWLVSDIAANNPMCLLVDDLHCADAASLRWLRYLVRRLEDLPVAVLATVGTGEVLSVECAALGRLAATRITLGGVDVSACAEIGQAILGEAGHPEFWQRCHAMANGNPLLLTTILRGFVAAGMHPTAQAAGEINRFGHAEVRRMTRSALAGYGEVAHQIVTALAVLGEQVDLEMLADVLSVERPELDDVLTRLNHGWLVDAGDGVASIGHPIVREVLTADLPRPVADQLHKAAAQALRQRNATPERIAAHLVATDPVGEAWAGEVLRMSAIEATRRGAPESAIRYLDRALAEPMDPPSRAALLVELGEIERAVDPASAMRRLKEGLDGPLPAPLRARAALDLMHLWSTNNNESISHHVNALRPIQAMILAEDPGLALLLEVEWIYAATASATLLPALLPRLKELTLTDGRGTPAERSLAGLLAYRGVMFGADRDAALTCARIALLPGRYFGDQAYVRNRALLSMAVAGEPLTALDHCDAMTEEAQRHGSPQYYDFARTMAAEVNFRLGRLDDCLADIRAVQAIRIPDLIDADCITACREVDTLIEQDRLEEAVALFTSFPEPPNEDDVRTGPWLLFTQGKLRVAQGQIRAGLDDLLSCGEILQRKAHHPNVALFPWRAEAVRAYLAIDDVEPARELATSNLQLAERWGSAEAIGAALRAMGTATPGRRGLDLLQESVRELANSPDRLEHAKALIDLGTALHRADQIEQARLALRQAIDLATTCAAHGLIRRAADRLRATGAKPRTRRFTGLDALTPTERRVARMATENLTNREIAQQIFVGVRTVEIHLTHTYRKLGISGRAELSAALKGNR